MKLVWTPPAEADRDAIYDYIETNSASAAIDLDELFAKRSAELPTHPMLGRPGRMPGTRELVVHRNYILVYDIFDQAVRVLRVLHTARHWPPRPE